MGRPLGRSSALVLAMAMLSVLGLTLWAADAASGGKIRRTVVTRLQSDDDSSRPGHRWTGKPGEKRRAPGLPGSSSRNGTAETSATVIFDASSSCTVSGLVTDEEHHPVQGARISVRGPGDFDRSVETDARGHFSLAALPTGTFDVFAKHESFVPLVRPGFTLTQSGEIAGLDFILPLGATLQGIVKDEEGKPLSDVRVLAHRRHMGTLDGGNVYLDDTSYKTRKTDREGTFSIAGVSLGGNSIEFRKPGYEGEVKELEVKAEKEQPKLEITLRRTGKLAGAVRDEAGNPVSTVTVHLVRYKPIQGPAEVIEKGKITVTSGVDGRFEFSKLYTEGFYDLQIDDERFAPAGFPLVPVGSMETACVLGQGGKIEGTVEYIDRASTEASVLLLAQTVTRETTFTKEVKSDGAGRFVLEKLPYGKYELMVRSSGLASEPKRDVACDRSGPTRGVVVEVYEASTVKGRVADGRTDGPVPGAMVTVDATYGPKGARHRTFQTRADQHGGFALFRLPAGSHVARASARGFLKTISDRSEARFTLQPGERKGDLALVLDRGGVVDGFVLDHHGRPVDGAEVQLFAASSLYGRIDDRGFKGRTDTTGHFVISGIEVGERTQLYASARKPGYAKTRSLIIDLTPRKPEVTTQLVLTPGSVITGRVSDRNDLPVPGALLRFESSEFPGDPSPSAVTAQARPDGTYVLANVTPGQGSVTVSRSGFVRQARGVAVKESEPTGNVNFKLEAGRQISGTVAALDGKPIAGARVSANPLDGASGSDEAVTDRNGKFTLSNLGEGAFRLDASFKLSTSDGDQFYRFTNPRVQSGRSDASIDCDVASVLTGVVVDQDDRGIPGVTISIRSRDDTKPAQDFGFQLDRQAQARGSFQVLKAPRGLYTMRVSAEGYEPYIQDDLAIGPTLRTDLPRIRLRSAGGVTGALISSSTRRPVNNVSVRLIDTLKPEAEARANAPSGTSDSSGVFRITSAVEGTYDVEFSHPNYQPYKVEGVHVTTRRLADLGRLYMEAGGAIRGTVTDEDGQPVRGLRLKVSGTNKEAYTDTAGNYLIQGVQAGRWNVVARGQMNDRTVYSFQVAAVQPDETESLDFHLETSADLDGVLASAGDLGPVQTGDVRIHPFDENALVLEDIHYDATASPADSSFEISRVPPGAYFLLATGIGAANAAYTAWQTLSLNRGRNETVVQVGGGTVSGKAVDSATAGPVKSVALQLRPLFDSLRLPQGVYDALVRNATTGPDGAYAFKNVQSGPYQVLYKPADGALYAQTPFSLDEQDFLTNYDVVVPPQPGK